MISFYCVQYYFTQHHRLVGFWIQFKLMGGIFSSLLQRFTRSSSQNDIIVCIYTNSVGSPCTLILYATDDGYTPMILLLMERWSFFLLNGRRLGAGLGGAGEKRRFAKKLRASWLLLFLSIISSHFFSPHTDVQTTATSLSAAGLLLLLAWIFIDNFFLLKIWLRAAPWQHLFLLPSADWTTICVPTYLAMRRRHQS